MCTSRNTPGDTPEQFVSDKWLYWAPSARAHQCSHQGYCVNLCSLNHHHHPHFCRRSQPQAFLGIPGCCLLCAPHRPYWQCWNFPLRVPPRISMTAVGWGGRSHWRITSYSRVLFSRKSTQRKEHIVKNLAWESSSALQNKIRWWFLCSGTKWSIGVHWGIILLGTTAGEWWCVPLGSSQMPGKDHCTGPDSLEASVPWVTVGGRLDDQLPPDFHCPPPGLPLRSACVYPSKQSGFKVFATGLPWYSQSEGTPGHLSLNNLSVCPKRTDKLGWLLFGQPVHTWISALDAAQTPCHMLTLAFYLGLP